MKIGLDLDESISYAGSVPTDLAAISCKADHG